IGDGLNLKPAGWAKATGGPSIRACVLLALSPAVPLHEAGNVVADSWVRPDARISLTGTLTGAVHLRKEDRVRSPIRESGGDGRGEVIGPGARLEDSPVERIIPNCLALGIATTLKPDIASIVRIAARSRARVGRAKIRFDGASCHRPSHAAV